MQKGPQRRPQGTPRDAPGPPKGPRRSPQGCPSGPQASQLVLWCRRNAHFSEKRAFRLHESTSQPPWGRQRGPLGTPVGHQIASLGPPGPLGVPQGSRVNSKEKSSRLLTHRLPKVEKSMALCMKTRCREIHPKNTTSQNTRPCALKRAF